MRRRVDQAMRALLLGAFWVWVPCVVVPGVYFLAWHTFGLPRPDARDGALAAALVAERRPEELGRWTALHVLSAGCGCSARVLERLAARSPVAGVVETILFIDGEPGPLLAHARAGGFRVEALTSEDLARRYHVEAAPLLIVADPEGEVRYVGGYTDRKRGPDVRDVAIVSGVRRGEVIAALPVLGCAVSRRLQRELDPMGLKYSEGPR